VAGRSSRSGVETGKTKKVTNGSVKSPRHAPGFASAVLRFSSRHCEHFYRFFGLVKKWKELNYPGTVFPPFLKGDLRGIFQSIPFH
jgi:hypothetical protein